jgi:hypothetical protein
MRWTSAPVVGRERDRNRQASLSEGDRCESPSEHDVEAWEVVRSSQQINALPRGFPGALVRLSGLTSSGGGSHGRILADR